MLAPMRQTSAVPEETAKVARRIFRKGNRYLLLRDKLGVLFADEAFAELFSTQGQPALSPGMLALVLVLAYCEGLSDRQAADAVHSRIDWKYLLGLPLDDEGFDASVLSEFRQRLVQAEAAERLLLERLLVLCQEQGLVKAGGKQRTDSTRILAAVRSLNRLQLVVETMTHTLEVLATVAPQWVETHLDVVWFVRYGQELVGWRWPHKQKEQQSLALLVGGDGFALLEALYITAPALYPLPAVQALRQIWVQQYYRQDESVQWREQADLPPVSRLLQTPHDLEARWSYKGDNSWVGYKVHLTELCEPDTPHLVTDVQTRPSGEPDQEALPAIQAALAQRGLRPALPLVDAGYLTAKSARHSHEQYGIDLWGQVEGDTSWQARHAPAYAADKFAVDWEKQHVTCPQGYTSRVWSHGKSREGYDVVRVRFAQADCTPCPARAHCLSGATARSLQLLRPQALYAHLQRVRQRVREPGFWAVYRARAGIEGTISFAVGALDMRQTRYVGAAKTHLHNLLCAVAINLLRLARWFAGAPRSRTHTSKLLAFMPAPCT